MNINIILDILLVIISSFAIYQYMRNKRDAIKSSATIVYDQLKGFDEYISNVRSLFDSEGGISDYHISVINTMIEENYWNKHKHVLLRKLNQDDIELINGVYNLAESIETARKRIIATFVTINDAKSFALQLQMIQGVRENQSDDEMATITNRYGALPFSFTSKAPHDIFKNQVTQYEQLTGTTTLKKLNDLAYKNKR